MDTKILKCLLSHEFYTANKRKLSSTLFDDEVEELFEVAIASHEKYAHDITTDELFALWQTSNPVAVRAKVAAVKDIVDRISAESPYSPDIASDLLHDLWRRDTGRRIAELGIAITEGKPDAYDRLNALLESSKDGYLPDDFPADTTQDLDQLLALTSDEARWRFNIHSLSRVVYGIGPGEFGIVFARPETGKTSFNMSIACGPKGFCEQGAKVFYAGNEEDTMRTMLRAYQACSGMTREEVIANPRTAKEAFASIADKLFMQDIQEWSISDLGRFIERRKPDVVLVDQLDKITVPGNWEGNGHGKFREIYLQARELAKKYKVAFIGNCQASNEATNKTILIPSMMEGSKTGKFAEADLILGIGKYTDNENGENDPIRFVTVGKNKLSGWHGTVPMKLEAAISRYVD